MAKKKNVQNFVPEQELYEEEVVLQEEVVFESEAYGNAQPDAGMGTTVCKPVGIGGPIPIIAPKNNTIQLQPIIVPMAVVPYMSQDADVLRTDGGSMQLVEEYDTAASDFSRMEAEQKVEKKAKSKKTGARVASAFMFLFSAVVLVAYLLAYFKPVIGTLDLGAHLNVLGDVIAWAKGTEPANMIITILHAVCLGFTAITLITTLITLFVGKYPSAFILILALVSSLAIDAALIYHAVDGTQKGVAFVFNDYLGYIIVAAVATVAFIISIIVTVAMGRKKDEYYYDDFGSQNLI